MPRVIKKVEQKMFHNRETFVKDVVNKSLTTEHCEFFLKKYGSDKVFSDYLNKYYPRNGGCSFHVEGQTKSPYFPQLYQEKSIHDK